MADLENAAKSLADALDALERRLDQRLHDLADAREATALVRRQTGVAHRFTAAAGEDLSRAISDLRAILSAPSGKDD